MPNINPMHLKVYNLYIHKQRITPDIAYELGISSSTVKKYLNDIIELSPKKLGKEIKRRRQLNVDRRVGYVRV